MNILFFASEKPREQTLAHAFTIGAERRGHTVVTCPSSDVTLGEGFDVACMVGVKSAEIWRRMQARGVRCMMFDKGYVRRKSGSSWLYWRVAYGGHQPTEHTMALKYLGDRFRQLDLDVAPWRTQGKHILIAGSSEKYHNFYGLPSPTEYAGDIVRQLRAYTARPVIYRPKPSWRDAVPIPGTTFSKGVSLAADLHDCHAIVTHGSNTCYEGALHGVPSVILGAGVMKRISSSKLRDIEHPLLGRRRKVFNALAYHQWRLRELERGAAFDTIERWFT